MISHRSLRALATALTLAGAHGCYGSGRDAPASPDAAPGASTPSADREVIRAAGAPAAIGPYSQAIRVGDTLWIAGQIGLDPSTGVLVEGGVDAETRQVLANLRAVLAEAGFRTEDVVQAQVFLADLDDYPVMNALYAEAFPRDPPARATVQVGRIPGGARVEIALVAVRTP